MSTYRELVQDIIASIDGLYDKCGALRDAAMHDEKEPFNYARGVLMDVRVKFTKLDNNMDDNRASMGLPWELPDWK